MNTETEYRNGGVTINLLKMSIAAGYKATPAELLTIAAHDAMPRGVFYTEGQVQAKRCELSGEQPVTAEQKWNELAKDGYEDLYGPYTPTKPARRSAYDRKHSPR